MFDHIAKRPPPSRVPIAAISIAIIIVGVVTVSFMLRPLVASRDQEEQRRPAVLHTRVSAPLPDLSPMLEAQVTGGSKRVDVKFGWRPPCRIPALQDTDKNGQRVRASFDLVLEPVRDLLTLRMQHMQVLMVNGETADSPALRGQLASMNALAAAAAPTFLVSMEGEYLGIANLDQSLDVVEKSTALAGPGMESAREAMRSPQMRAMLEQAAGGYWNAWAGAWLGLQLAPGEHLERTVEIELPGGATMKVPFTLSHRGTIAGTDGMVLLDSVQVLEGPEAARLMLQTIRSMAAQVGGPPPADNATEHFRREAIVRVALDPATSRVHRARTEMTVEVAGQRRTTVEDVAFDWAHAEGCGTKAL
jgi:hypothetical protein